MTELLGPKGLLTNILAYGAVVPALLFIGIIGYLVMKDFPIMDRQGRYMSSFFKNRKKETKTLLCLWFVCVVLMVGAVISSKQ